MIVVVMVVVNTVVKVVRVFESVNCGDNGSGDDDASCYIGDDDDDGDEKNNDDAC